MAQADTTGLVGGSASASARRRALTAFFDDRAAAQAAIDDVVAAGIDRARVTLVEGGPEPVAHEATDSAHKSLWQSFKELFMADEDRHAYGEGLRRGGFLVSVDTSAGDHDRVVDILDRDGAVDIDARQADWQLEGWDPVRAAADLAPSAAVGPAFGTADIRPSDAAPHAGRIASATAGSAFGRDVPHPAAALPAGPTAIRDPGAGSPRLRTYVESHVRRDPEDDPLG